MASMIAHWAAASSRDAVGGRHRARLAKRLHEARAPCLVCTERPDREAARHRRRRQHREPGRLLPEDGTLVVADDDVDPGNAERLERGVERRSVELAGRGVDDGVPGRALDDDSGLRREGLEPADAPGRDR